MYREIKPQEGTGAPRAPLTCHCEERSDVAISQYPAASWESYRRKRNCLPEIATAPLGPRNDKPEGIAPMNLCRKHCQPAWRSLPARGTPLQTQSVCTTLSILNVSCKRCAGRGMPRPYNARLAALQHFPLSIFHEKKSRTCVREFFSQSSIQILKPLISPSGSPLRPSGPRRAAPCPSGSASPATGSSR